jgi:hypothetical protein
MLAAKAKYLPPLQRRVKKAKKANAPEQLRKTVGGAAPSLKK